MHINGKDTELCVFKHGIVVDECDKDKLHEILHDDNIIYKSIVSVGFVSIFPSNLYHLVNVPDPKSSRKLIAMSYLVN